MAFDFPSSPSFGQTFTPSGGPTYTWNGYGWTTGAAGNPLIISDTPPASPVQGSLWWESDTGRLYISYNDGNTTQWVSIVSFNPAGGGAAAGNVSNVGTPADNQLAIWTDPTHIEGSGASLTFDGTNFNAPTVTPSSDSSTKVATTAFVQSALGSGGFSTGDVKLTLKVVADAGWILMNDGSIGSASSGATYANAAAQALFTLLYTNITDTWCPIQTSTGAATTRAAQTNAATAWANNCRMMLPRVLGRALAGTAPGGTGSGLTARGLGQYNGEETHAPTVSELVAHNHAAAANTSYNYVFSTSAETITYDGSMAYVISPIIAVGYYNGVAVSTSNYGGSTPANQMQPTSFMNVMIKL